MAEQEATAEGRQAQIDELRARLADRDLVALAEMAAWLKGGERELTLYRNPHSGIEIDGGDYQLPNGAQPDWTAKAPTIAEAWASLKVSEGWPG